MRQMALKTPPDAAAASDADDCASDSDNWVTDSSTSLAND